MGWLKELKADKDLLFSDVEKIVNSLPSALLGVWPSSLQDWGWGRLTDIDKPEGKILTISGAYYSEQYADLMAHYLAIELKDLGYKIKAGKTI